MSEDEADDADDAPIVSRLVDANFTLSLTVKARKTVSLNVKGSRAFIEISDANDASSHGANETSRGGRLLVDYTEQTDLPGNPAYQEALERYKRTFARQSEKEKDGILDDLLERFCFQRLVNDDVLTLSETNARTMLVKALSKSSASHQPTSSSRRASLPKESTEPPRQPEQTKQRAAKRDKEDLIVYCGGGTLHRNKPGNMAYLEAVSSAQSKYMKLEASQKKQMVNAIADQFNFCQLVNGKWKTARDDWVREKICKVFHGLRVKHTVAGSRTDGDVKPVKPIVYCGSVKGNSNRSEPGNLAYIEAISLVQGEYKRSNETKRKLLVDDIARQFDFRRFVDGAWQAAATDDWLRNKIDKAFTALKGQSSSSPKTDSPAKANPPTSTRNDPKVTNKQVVNCGPGAVNRQPGNVAYFDCIASLHNRYVKTKSLTEKQSMVDSVLERFEFLENGRRFNDARARKKVQSALVDPRYIKRSKRKAEPLMEDRRVKPRLASHVVAVASPQASRRPTSEMGQCPREKHELEKLVALTGKQIVYCGSGKFLDPGNIAYVDVVHENRKGYLAAGRPKQELIVNSIWESFNFQRPADKTRKQWIDASDDWAKEKIRNALTETRHDTKAGLTAAARQAATKSDAGTETSMTMEQLLLGASKTGRPVVFCGHPRWQTAPGNIAYMETISEHRESYWSSDEATKKSIVDTIKERYNFQVKVTETKDSWQPASVTLVMEKIRKAFRGWRDRQVQKGIQVVDDASNAEGAVDEASATEGEGDPTEDVVDEASDKPPNEEVKASDTAIDDASNLNTAVVDKKPSETADHGVGDQNSRAAE